MVCVLPKFLGDEFHQLVLDFDDVPAGGDAGPVGDPENMGVHRDGGFAERGVEDHVSGLAAHSRQTLEVFALARYFAAELFQQDSAGGEDVLRLGPVQSDAADERREPGFAKRKDRLRRVGDREKPVGGEVHAFVGGLGGEYDRNQQLEWCLIREFGGRRRIGFSQPAENFCSFGCIQLLKPEIEQLTTKARRKPGPDVSARSTLHPWISDHSNPLICAHT